MVGGKRGAGKSVICANIANNVYESGKSVIYFTIEMDSRSILQRCCAIATQVPFSRLRTRGGERERIGRGERVCEKKEDRKRIADDQIPTQEYTGRNGKFIFVHASYRTFKNANRGPVVPIIVKGCPAENNSYVCMYVCMYVCLMYIIFFITSR